MGCDIHSFAEKRVEGKWQLVPFTPFDWRSYGLFGFLAGVRNYSGVQPIAEPRGLPDDISPEVREASDCSDWHSHSWLSVEELAAFNYDAAIEDRRETRQIAANLWSGAETCKPGEGKQTTWRKFLGPDFFRDLGELKREGVERVVFWFDN